MEDCGKGDEVNGVMDELSIRFAVSENAPVIFELVQALASYERLTHEVISNADDFRKSGQNFLVPGDDAGL
jgi:hypothetical protein